MGLRNLLYWQCCEVYAPERALRTLQNYLSLYRFYGKLNNRNSRIMEFWGRPLSIGESKRVFPETATLSPGPGLFPAS